MTLKKEEKGKGIIENCQTNVADRITREKKQKRYRAIGEKK